VFTASRPRWLSSISLQLPSWTNWLPAAELWTQLDSTPLTEVRVRITLRLAVYRQSVRLGAKPLEVYDQRFFLQLNPNGHSPYATSSLTTGWVCLLWICLAFRQVYVSHLQRVIENSSLRTIYKSSVSTGFAKQIMPNLRILCYNGSLVTWTVVIVIAAKFKPPLILSMCGFALSYTTNMFILMIL
jgi:hypothetical protein